MRGDIYVQNPGDPVPVYLHNQKSYWDTKTNDWAGSAHASHWLHTQSFDPSDLPAGYINIPLSPTDNWVTEAQIKQIWIEEEQRRKQGERLLLDALLYTDNMIFASTHSRTKSEGNATFNGGLIAKDTGVLIGKGFELNYDERVQRHLGIVDYEETELRRGATWLQRRASTYHSD